MKRFRNILLVAGLEDGPVPNDFFGRALSLARTNEARLTVMDIVHESELFREILPPEAFEAVRRERHQSLARLAEIGEEQGVQIETELLVGKPFLEIVRKVQRSEHDLVMTDGGRAEDTPGQIDSRTMHLMRKCPCAIWVVRPPLGNRYPRILAAIDPDPGNPERDSLNRKIIELAVSMAKLEESDLHVAHVWELYGLPVGATGEVWKQWERTAGRQIKRRLHDFLADCDLGSDPQVHFVAGKPAVAISRLASQMQVDLLVMGTVCRTGVRGFFIGNTAEGVLQRVACSLMTVKPEGFVSPV